MIVSASSVRRRCRSTFTPGGEASSAFWTSAQRTSPGPREQVHGLVPTLDREDHGRRPAISQDPPRRPRSGQGPISSRAIARLRGHPPQDPSTGDLVADQPRVRGSSLRPPLQPALELLRDDGVVDSGVQLVGRARGGGAEGLEVPPSLALRSCSGSDSNALFTRIEGSEVKGDRDHGPPLAEVHAGGGPGTSVRTFEHEGTAPRPLPRGVTEREGTRSRG